MQYFASVNQLINIGKIVATFGVKGEVILKHGLGKKVNLKGVEALFVEQTKGSHIPYFVQSSKAKTTDEMYVLLEGMSSKETAHKLISRQVWLQDDDFRKLAGKQSAITLIGYTLINQGTVVGIVDEVIEQPHQVLLSVNYQGKEALIPLHEDSLEKINHAAKEVHVILPDGLLDVYS